MWGDGKEPVLGCYLVFFQPDLWGFWEGLFLGGWMVGCWGAFFSCRMGLL